MVSYDPHGVIRKLRPMKWLLTKATEGAPLTGDQALALLGAPPETMDLILEAATAARKRTFGDRATLCSILNAKSGACSEDCVFCAQSSRHSTHVKTYPLLDADEIAAAYHEAEKLPVDRFGIVTSGRALTGADLILVCDTIARTGDTSISWCASLGSLDRDSLLKLRAAGLKRFHHNLETAESFFPNICTTHTYAERVETVKAAKAAGLEVCSGALFGLGETRAHRVELALALRELAVDSIPLNFLVPIPGTPAADAEHLSPDEILKTIAMFRLVCPETEIKVCGGRETNLADLEHLIFAAGANGMMIGGYLTLRGRSVEEDLHMLRNAGIQP